MGRKIKTTRREHPKGGGREKKTNHKGRETEKKLGTPKGL